MGKPSLQFDGIYYAFFPGISQGYFLGMGFGFLFTGGADCDTIIKNRREIR